MGKYQNTPQLVYKKFLACPPPTMFKNLVILDDKRDNVVNIQKLGVFCCFLFQIACISITLEKTCLILVL